MNNRLIPSPVAAAVSAALLLPVTAAGQESDSLVEEILVTAAKREQSIYEVPIALSAFDGDKLAEQGIVNIYDVGKFARLRLSF